jgi:hypothetical protein
MTTYDVIKEFEELRKNNAEKEAKALRIIDEVFKKSLQQTIKLIRKYPPDRLDNFLSSAAVVKLVAKLQPAGKRQSPPTGGGGNGGKGKMTEEKLLEFLAVERKNEDVIKHFKVSAVTVSVALNKLLEQGKVTSRTPKDGEGDKRKKFWNAK